MQRDLNFLKSVLSVPTKTYQEDLMIDLHGMDSDAANAKRKPLPTKLVVQLASNEEQEAHQAYLEDVAKAAKKPPVWS
jgi:DNA polymerase-3 subunit epsilon